MVRSQPSSQLQVDSAQESEEERREIPANATGWRSSGGGKRPRCSCQVPRCGLRGVRTNQSCPLFGEVGDEVSAVLNVSSVSWRGTGTSSSAHSASAPLLRTSSGSTVASALSVFA